MKANAEKFSNQLKAQGFKTEIRKAVVNGKTYFRVFKLDQQKTAALAAKAPVAKAASAVNPNGNIAPVAQAGSDIPKYYPIRGLFKQFTLFYPKTVSIYSTPDLSGKPAGTFGSMGGGLMLGINRNAYVMKMADRSIGYIRKADVEVRPFKGQPYVDPFAGLPYETQAPAANTPYPPSSIVVVPLSQPADMSNASQMGDPVMYGFPGGQQSTQRKSALPTVQGAEQSNSSQMSDPFVSSLLGQ